eukprot:CAMPEP_0119405134 /NCGR_PEP_ID=MMETSP1334-20130426/144246_1 /TAXON_ID=127549 /ORGANISM="Calcidiscus leptoporus, Strain RCC1130" /LENGTH=153 /DNA_ID=CAMNT_0007429105 /DNA_START=635 /DNA_END=1094 /DNA_ORIENTATION=+
MCELVLATFVLVQPAHHQREASSVRAYPSPQSNAVALVRQVDYHAAPQLPHHTPKVFNGASLGTHSRHKWKVVQVVNGRRIDVLDRLQVQLSVDIGAHLPTEPVELVADRRFIRPSVAQGVVLLRFAALAPAMKLLSQRRAQLLYMCRSLARR